MLTGAVSSCVSVDETFFQKCLRDAFIVSFSRVTFINCVVLGVAEEFSQSSDEGRAGNVYQRSVEEYGRGCTDEARPSELLAAAVCL